MTRFIEATARARRVADMRRRRANRGGPADWARAIYKRCLRAAWALKSLGWAQSARCRAACVFSNSWLHDAILTKTGAPRRPRQGRPSDPDKGATWTKAGAPR
eukprot:8776337-Pyramimonas_sp.AAC.1